jgi:hypothetical protein
LSHVTLSPNTEESKEKEVATLSGVVSTLSAKSAASRDNTVSGLNGMQTVVSKPEFVMLTMLSMSGRLVTKSKVAFTPLMVAIMTSVT